MPATLVIRAAVLGALLASLLPTAPALAASAPAGFRPFADDSPWNLPLRADAPLSRRSAASVAWLGAKVAAGGAYINTYTCAMPTYWAEPGTPRVPVKLVGAVYRDPALINAWAAVPIPPETVPAKCSDANFAVIQRQPDGTLDSWEFWKAAKAADGSWTARWGGATQDLQRDRGFASTRSWTDPDAPAAAARQSHHNWNVTASSMSMMAGVITARDVERGRIDHALALALPDAAMGSFLWPAQRADGGSTEPGALPEGARLRIDPALDLAKVPMVPLVRMMAEAAQRHGIIVRDRTWSNTVFYTEEVRAGAPDPFRPLLGGKWPDAALKAFPWDRLQLVAAPECTGSTGCRLAEQVTIHADGAARAGAPLALDTSASALEHPREAVAWDLDGNGSFEHDAGRAVGARVVPAAPGRLEVRVRITTVAGSVLTASRTLDVAPLAGATPPPGPSPSPAPPAAPAPARAPVPAAAPGTTPPGVPAAKGPAAATDRGRAAKRRRAHRRKRRARARAARARAARARAAHARARARRHAAR